MSRQTIDSYLPHCKADYRLLEVIFAIAILGTALAAIGQLGPIRNESRWCRAVQSLSQILADARMSEIACGALPLESNSGAMIEDSPGWQYSVQVQPAAQIGSVGRQSPGSASHRRTTRRVFRGSLNA